MPMVFIIKNVLVSMKSMTPINTPTWSILTGDAITDHL